MPQDKKPAYRTDPIYVKPYVRDFIQNQPLNKVCYGLLVRFLQLDCKRYENDTKLEGLVPVQIPLKEDDFRNYGFRMTFTNETSFRLFLEDYIREILDIRWEAAVAQAKRKKLTMRGTIDDYRDKYNLSEESLPFKTLKMHIIRRNKKNGFLYINEKKVIGKL